MIAINYTRLYRMDDDEYYYAYSTRALYGTYHYITAYNDFLTYIYGKTMARCSSFAAYLDRLRMELHDWTKQLTMKQWNEITASFTRQHGMQLEPYTEEEPQRQLAYLVLSDAMYRDTNLQNEYDGVTIPISEMYKGLTIAQNKN